MNSTFEKQVDKKHYAFSKYFYKGRWMSYYYQINEVMGIEGVENILEIGPGTNLLKNMLHEHRPYIEYKSIDIAEDLQPDYLGSVQDMPLPDNSFDVVCAFQVLEHMPYDTFVQNLTEMKRVARKRVIISIPHTAAEISFQWKIPFMRRKQFFLRIPFPSKHEFDGQHYWEVGKKGYAPSRIRSDISSVSKIIKEYVPFENQYHRFYVLEV